MPRRFSPNRQRLKRELSILLVLQIVDVFSLWVPEHRQRIFHYATLHHPLTLSFQAYNLPLLQILPTAALPFSFQDSLHGFCRLFTVISERICFLLLVFFPVFTLFSCRFRAVD